jgi:hypothetical protein
MERRNWSLEAYKKLLYVDSLDDKEKAHAVKLWTSKYLDDNFLNKLDLDNKDLENFTELFYKTVHFLKSYNNNISKELDNNKNIKKFFT